MLLFETVHGSHLYGTAGVGSDLDIYRVVSSKEHKNEHSVSDGYDLTEISYHQWLKQCDKGVPQALEAMFSPKPSVDRLSTFRSSYRVGVSSAISTHRRTIRSFLKLDPTPKRISHAVRLSYSVGDLYRYGRIFPVLTGERKESVMFFKLLEVYDETEIRLALTMSNHIATVELFDVEEDLPVILERLDKMT